jgi:hypothetical protein
VPLCAIAIRFPTLLHPRPIDFEETCSAVAHAMVDGGLTQP